MRLVRGRELVCKRLKTAKTPPLLIRKNEIFSHRDNGPSPKNDKVDGGISYRINIRMKARKEFGGKRQADFVKNGCITARTGRKGNEYCMLPEHAKSSSQDTCQHSQWSDPDSLPSVLWGGSSSATPEDCGSRGGLQGQEHRFRYGS